MAKLKKGFIRNFFRLFLKVCLWFFVITFCWVLLYRWVNPPITYLMIERWVDCEKKECSINKTWKGYDEISENMVLAVVVAEDQNYFKHYGFDFGAIKKAMNHNEKSKKKRGASTISQQVAKNVFLWPGRSWVRKGFEVYFTALIELLWSKKRIIEVYLNVIELGDGIYGVEAISKKCFKKSAYKLSRSEAALIAITLPNPLKMNACSPTKYLRGRQSWAMNQMRLFGGTKYLDKYIEPKNKKK